MRLTRTIETYKVFYASDPLEGAKGSSKLKMFEIRSLASSHICCRLAPIMNREGWYEAVSRLTHG